MVNDGARIGSNSVVVKEVRAGATMVGIPAHEVGSVEYNRANGKDDEVFEAYGLKTSGDDPIAVAIHGLCEQMQTMAEYNNHLLKQLNKTGVDIGNLESPEIKTDCIELQRFARNSGSSEQSLEKRTKKSSKT